MIINYLEIEITLYLEIEITLNIIKYLYIIPKNA